MVKRILKLTAFLAFITGVIFVSFGVSSDFLVAQSGKTVDELRQESINENASRYREITIEDVKENMFAKDKSGCTSKAVTFFTMMQRYRKGKSVDDFVNMAAMRPIFEEYFQDIRQKGVERAYLSSMSGYKDCVANAQPNENPEVEARLQKIHGQCTALTNIVMDTLGGIKARKSANTMMNKYQRANVNLSSTSFGHYGDPAVYVVAKLYDTAKTKSYEDVVGFGYSLVMSCAAS